MFEKLLKTIKLAREGLLSDKETLEKQLSAMDTLLGTKTMSKVQTSTQRIEAQQGAVERRRPVWSTASRKAAGARMKARWAEHHAAAAKRASKRASKKAATKKTTTRAPKPGSRVK